jgi:hypothetical protein
MGENELINRKQKTGNRRPNNDRSPVSGFLFPVFHFFIWQRRSAAAPRSMPDAAT